jgi:hypothetical protein
MSRPLTDTLSFRIFHYPARYDVFNKVPSYYLITTNDQCFSLFTQENMAKMGKFEVVERLHSSHTPWLSHLDYVINFIRRGAGEKLPAHSELD